MTNKSTYIAGETATYSLTDAAYTAVTVKYGSISVAATLASGVWTATIATDALDGAYNFAAFADGEAVETGTFVVRPLVSRWRAVADAVEAAIQSWGTNPNQTISVGEINISYKTLDDLIRLRSYYAGKADADEGGTTSSGAVPFRIRGAFA